MTSSLIIPKVIDVIARTQQIPSNAISPEQSFEELGIDSLGGLAIISELEKEFLVEIPNEQAFQLRDVPQTVECLQKILASPGTEAAVG
jgi:acyl carrier protein